MNTANQEKFMRRIRAALGHAPDVARDGQGLFPQVPAAAALALCEGVRRRTAPEREILFDRLIAAAQPINLHVQALPDVAAVAAGIAELVQARSPEWGDLKQVAAWSHPLIDRLNLPKALEEVGVPVFVTTPIACPGDPEGSRKEREDQRREIVASCIGVTTADFCLADTATLVLRNRPGQPRTVALLPSIHVAVVTLDQIVADMKELFALLQWDEGYRQEGLTNYMSFISGPSKTGDIEAIMVHGAHGPKEVCLYVVTGCSEGKTRPRGMD
jgi:L-lactate dehydrogenase complex protein LldG